jgi:anhydro-N-acetylmuramic acid kinase
MPEYYIGLMSGTSMDGIDAALMDFSTNPPKLIYSSSKPWSRDLHSNLLATRKLSDNALNHLQALDTEIGETFAELCNELLKKTGIPAQDIIAIGSHGQTIRHRPNATKPFSLQLGKADVLASQTGINVISDFRAADIEAGGQGAPLTPAFHAAAFRTSSEKRTILNIGGIANITILPDDKNKPVKGFDSGPGNTLMDAWMIKIKNNSYDLGGNFARKGNVNEALLSSFLSDAYFKKKPPKSTGFEDFNLDWVDTYLKEDLPAQDVQATLCELTAKSITDAIRQCGLSNSRILVCGGGIHNTYLMERIKHLMKDSVIESTQTLGIHPDFVEAIAFAWLARQTIKRLPGNLPSVTGARKAVVLGKLSRPS